MMMKNRKNVAIMMLVLLAFCHFGLAFAEVVLPEGAVAGLPEKLSVLDSDGNSASSSTGEYFFLVEGMQPFTTYTKNIQITNLREDKSYHIYFYAEPIDKSGDIDLEEECTAVFSLNGTKVFEGKVNGEASEGWNSINEEPMDLGIYKPGDIGKLSCDITWDGYSIDNCIDNGHTLIDENGTHIIREKEGEEYISGEVRFRWVFYAVVEEEVNPPKTGILATGYVVYSIILGSMLTTVVVLLVMIKKKEKSREKK